MSLEPRQLFVSWDDLGGAASKHERKRRQNRLNQRAFRNRLKLQQDKSDLQRPGGVSPSLSPTSAPSSGLSPSQPPSLAPSSTNKAVPRMLSRDQHALTSHAMAADRGHLLIPCPHRSSAIQFLRTQAYQGYALNAPRPSQLQFLIRLNVLDAIARNALVLGIPVHGLCEDDFISPFALQTAAPPLRLVSASALAPFVNTPPSLSPTTLQRTIRHHPWIDLFPLPRLRDNTLLALNAGAFDEDELCDDLLNVEDANRANEDKPSLIVWGEPWDVRGWEASVAFLRKWAWLARGCPELIEATNHWRAKRGEKRLVLDLSDEENAAIKT